MKKTHSLILAVTVLLTLFAFTCRAETVTPTLTDEVSVRVAEPYGIRVVASLEKQQANDKNTTEYGFIATRLALLKMYGVHVTELCKDSPVPKKIGISKGTVDGETVNNIFTSDETSVNFGAYFFGINEYNYLDQVVIRPYAENNGVSGYGDFLVTSLYEQARRAYDGPLFEEYGEDAQQVVTSIVETAEASFSPSADKLRIVLDVTTSETDEGYFCNLYRVLDLSKGSISCLQGNREFVTESEVTSLAEYGDIVAIEGKKIEDRLRNSVVTQNFFADQMWIESISDDGKIILAPTDGTLACRDCVKDHIKDNAKTYKFEKESVTVMQIDADDEKLENALVSTAGIEQLSAKEKSLLCFFAAEEETLYSDYVKALVMYDENKLVLTLSVLVNGNENAAKGETCEFHTLVSILRRGSSELDGMRLTGIRKTARDLVVSTITGALAEADSGVRINKDYIFSKYSASIAEVKRIMKEEMNSTVRTNFLTSIKKNVSKDVQDFLIEYFDIDTSKI